MSEMNMGIDFGSTYSSFSYYDRQSDAPKGIVIGEGGAVCVPSCVAKDGDEYFFGDEAKLEAGNEDVQLFTAFKMLLTGDNSKELKKRGYAAEVEDRALRYSVDSPSGIAKRFLDGMIDHALEKVGVDRIGSLYVGVPEIWFRKVSTMDGARTVQDICKRNPKVGKIRVVSEPLAASAFFAHNYKIKTGRMYEGHMLLIDYGGGTLDIALTAMAPKKDRTDTLEIDVIGRTGAGENDGERIGNAGISYMEAVVVHALKAAGLGDDEIIRDTDFQKEVNDLEAKLKSGAKRIKNKFIGAEYAYDQESGRMVWYPTESLARQTLLSKNYKNHAYDVTYQDLLDVYNSEICPVLNEKLSEMTDHMKRHGVNYEDSNSADFKIANVGGFGNYCLVMRQIQGFFDLGEQDLRTQDIINNEMDREQAVSFGAALLADEVITISNKAQYSVGLFAEGGQADAYHMDYAITKGMPIEYEKKYFVVSKSDGKPISYFVQGGITHLLYNDSDDIYNPKEAVKLPVSSAYQQEIRKLSASIGSSGALDCVNIAFSVDSSNVFTIYMAPIKNHDLMREIELDSIKRICGKGIHVLEHVEE